MRDIKSEEINEDNLRDKEQKIAIEKQIATLQWIQTIAVLTEAILLSKLYLISDQHEGEDKILTGIWVQALGQLTEALGVTQQVSTSNKNNKFNAQQIATAGDFIQSFGAALQGFGGLEVLLEDGETIIP